MITLSILIVLALICAFVGCLMGLFSLVGLLVSLVIGVLVGALAGYIAGRFMGTETSFARNAVLGGTGQLRRRVSVRHGRHPRHRVLQFLCHLRPRRLRLHLGGQ